LKSVEALKGGTGGKTLFQSKCPPQNTKCLPQERLYEKKIISTTQTFSKISCTPLCFDCRSVSARITTEEADWSSSSSFYWNLFPSRHAPKLVIEILGRRKAAAEKEGRKCQGKRRQRGEVVKIGKNLKKKMNLSRGKRYDLSIFFFA